MSDTKHQVYSLPALALAFIVPVLAVASLCSSEEHSVSPDTLPVLVPERLELGPRIGNFEVNWAASDFVTLDQAVQASFDPAEDRLDLERLGWRAEYIRSFSPSSSDESGVDTLAVGIALYEDGQGALSRVDDIRTDVFSNVGGDNGRWAVLDAQPLQFESLGTNSGGAKVQISNVGAESPRHGTLLWFSQGQMAVTISIGSNDATDYTEEAHSLALTISGMIQTITGAA